MSDQNKTVLPLPISALIKELARGLILSNFLQIQDPFEEYLASQKEPCRIRLRFVQATHNDPAMVNNFLISRRENIRATSLRCRMPNPPSALGIYNSYHATLAFVVLFGEPLQRNAAHILSISLKHRCGRRKAEHQKLEMLEITDLMSCKRPA